MINTQDFIDLDEVELQDVLGGGWGRDYIQKISEFLSDLFGKDDKK